MTDEVTVIPADPTDPTISYPARSVIVQLQFEVEGEPSPDIYNASVEQPHGAQPADFAKALAEIVERTALLHLGALPVLTKVQAPA